MSIPVVSAVLSIIETGGKLFTNWQERKKIESQGKVAVAKAKVEGAVKRHQTVVEGDVNYDNIAAEGMKFSWKDEWFTVLLSVPFIMCFIPRFQPFVKTGFEVLKNSTPDWYQWAFLGAIVASFGLRGWNFFKNTRNGI